MVISERKKAEGRLKFSRILKKKKRGPNHQVRRRVIEL